MNAEIEVMTVGMPTEQVHPYSLVITRWRLEGLGKQRNFLRYNS